MKNELLNIAKSICNELLGIALQILILVFCSYIIYILWEYVSPIFNLPTVTVIQLAALLTVIKIITVWVFIGLKIDIGSKNTSLESNANTNINK